MLLREQRRGHENGYLLATVDRGECRTQCDFGLAVADIAADDTIHRAVRRQVLEHLANRSILVFGFLERESILEGTIVRFVPAEAVSGPRGTPRIHVQELGGNIADPLDRAPLGFGPLIGAEAMQRRILGRGARITRDQLEGVYRHVKLVTIRVFEVQEFAARATRDERGQAEITPDAVFLVNDRRTWLQVV